MLQQLEEKEITKTKEKEPALEHYPAMEDAARQFGIDVKENTEATHEQN